MYLGFVPDADFVRPYAKRAIDQLGYLDPECLDVFIEILIENWNRGPKNGHYHLMNWMTEKAACRQKAAYEVSFWHVLNAARRDLKKKRELGVIYRRDGSRSPLWAGFRFSAAPQKPCAPAVALNGALLEDHPDLPLQGCDREVCSCWWSMITARELKKG